MSDYQSQIAAQSSIIDVAALQQLLSNVDNSVHAFNTVQQAAINNDASTVTGATLGNILSLTVDLSVLADYQQQIAAANNIANVTALQAIIDTVDASVASVSAVQQAALSSDASTIDALLLSQIIDIDFSAANITGYQANIANAASIADVTALQQLLQQVDDSEAALARIDTAASNSDASDVTMADFSALLGLTDAQSYNLNAYQARIAAANSGELSDVSAVQALVNAVNAEQTLLNQVNDITLAGLSSPFYWQDTALLTDVQQDNLADYVNEHWHCSRYWILQPYKH